MFGYLLRSATAAPFLDIVSMRGGSDFPYTLGVRDSFMVGHSFRGNPDFGPAANMVRTIFDFVYRYIQKQSEN